MRFKFPVLALGILASGLAIRPGDAATASASISVSATVQASCLVSANAPAFRNYAAAANAASAVSVACSNSTPYTVTLSATPAPGATAAIRPMAGSGFVLLGAGLSPKIRGIADWGQAKGADGATGSGSGSGPVPAINGWPSAAQYTRTIAYGDTITVLVTY